MKFSIVTPSFRQSEWLRLCVASVADQEGVDVEHIVQDACSDDGTQEWLLSDGRVKAFCEKDDGMYDAVNRGYRRATGDVLAYLNCDEQYLPGALAAVGEFFEKNPQTEVALAGAIFTDVDGRYICHRQQMVPHPYHIWYRFPISTCSMFIRASVVHSRGLFFDTRWRTSGDFHWILALMRSGVTIAPCPGFSSAFTFTGDNLSRKPTAIREVEETMKMAPRLARLIPPVWNASHLCRKVCAGHFWLPSMTYQIYTKSSPCRRIAFQVPRPTTCLWSRLIRSHPVWIDNRGAEAGHSGRPDLSHG